MRVGKVAETNHCKMLNSTTNDILQSYHKALTKTKHYNLHADRTYCGPVELDGAGFSWAN